MAIYDDLKVYKRWTHGLQKHYGITQSQFHAARRAGRDKWTTPKMMEWVQRQPQWRGQALAAGAAHAETVAEREERIQATRSLDHAEPLVTLHIPASQVAKVLDVLGWAR